MRSSKFSESQIVAILKQQDAGVKVADICREHLTTPLSTPDADASIFLRDPSPFSISS
jgi:hypothetical protein